MDVWRRTAGVQTWRYGGGLQACTRGGIEGWSSGGLKVRCRLDILEVWSAGDSSQVY